MMIEYQREPIRVSEAAITAFSQAYQETDVIVPDSKPDVATVLQVDANAAIVSKACKENRIDVEATVRLNILYIGEDNTVWGINTTQNISHQIEAKGANENMGIDIECDVENVEYEILNSRKLNVRTLVGFDARVSMPLEIDVITNVGGNNVQTLSKNINPYCVVDRVDSDIEVKEKLEVPAGKPSIGHMLKTDTSVRLSDLKLASNKLIIKGALLVKTLYIGDMEDDTIQFMEHEVSFTEIIEAKGADEGMSADIDLGIKEISIDVVEDGDGDVRVLIVDAIINASGKVCKQVSIDIIEDLYGTEKKVEAVKNATLVDKIAADKKMSVTLSEVTVLPEHLPQVAQVYNVIAKPYLSNTKVENGQIMIEGVIDVYILYLSGDENQPLCTHKHEQPFSQRMDAENVSEDMFCDVKISVDNTSFNINLEREIQIRMIVTMQAKVIATDKLEYVSEIAESEEEVEKKSKSCIKIYFVQAGDKLWDIAKKYRTTISDIMSANELASEADVKPGCKILIP